MTDEKRSWRETTMIMMMMIRLELHTENSKPQLVFMDQIEEIGTDLVTVTF